MNFKSKAAYHRYLAYVHGTGVAEKTPGSQPVKIRGKVHKVDHETNVKGGKPAAHDVHKGQK